MSDGSKWWNALIGFIHGTTPASALSADAHKLLTDVQVIAAGVLAAAPQGPSLLADIAKLTAEATALAASRGLDLPELVAAGITLEQLARDFQKAQAAFSRGMANYQTAAAVVAAIPALSAT